MIKAPTDKEIEAAVTILKKSVLLLDRLCFCTPYGFVEARGDKMKGNKKSLRWLKHFIPHIQPK